MKTTIPTKKKNAHVENQHLKYSKHLRKKIRAENSKKNLTNVCKNLREFLF